eukprot:comp12228_c0_seq1/m.7006 comp12228_c0_seq1/g.7006  ORF comp12228_c0_seq1/g.7006 comp12228_c0_seq1/m.7006 type:complete len:157 (-) comp12228_c0_seq1:80-550(-)
MASFLATTLLLISSVLSSHVTALPVGARRHVFRPMLSPSSQLATTQQILSDTRTRELSRCATRCALQTPVYVPNNNTTARESDPGYTCIYNCALKVPGVNAANLYPRPLQNLLAVERCGITCAAKSAANGTVSTEAATCFDDCAKDIGAVKPKPAN